MKQLALHWMNFLEIGYFRFFETLLTQFKFHYKLTRITGTLQED